MIADLNDLEPLVHGIPDRFVDIIVQAEKDGDWSLAGHRFAHLISSLKPADTMTEEAWLAHFDLLVNQMPPDSYMAYRAAFMVWGYITYPDMAASIPKEHCREFFDGAYDQVFVTNRHFKFD